MNGQDEVEQRAAALEADQRVRWRRATILLGAVLLAGLLVGLMLGRLLNPVPVTPAPIRVEVALATWQGPELMLDRQPVWLRSEHAGAVSILLPDARLIGEPVQGSLQQGRQRGSWRVEQTPKGVEVLLVSLAGTLDATLQSRSEGQQWRLAVQVRLLEPGR